MIKRSKSKTLIAPNSPYSEFQTQKLENKRTVIQKILINNLGLAEKGVVNLRLELPIQFFVTKYVLCDELFIN